MADSIPRVVADFETSLDQSVSEGATTATLLSIVDTDGINLTNGYYGFTIDNDTDYKEYVLCTLTGTALTNIFSVSDQGVATAGLANYHRRGAVVQITDHVSLRRVVETLTGQRGIDNTSPLYYDATPALGSGLQLATVQYVLDTVNGGAVSFNATVIAGDAGETIADGDWVYQLTTDGEWYKTDADAITTSQGVRIGKARGTGTNGNPISGGIFIGGLETVGTYTPGQAYYLSNTAGALSTSAGTNSVLVGYGDANSDLVLNDVSQSAVDASTGSVGTPSTVNKFLTQLNTSTGIDQSQTTQNTTVLVGEANATTRSNKVAQSFIPTYTKIRGVRLYKSANSGSFTGTVTIALQANSAGNPSGVDLATVTLTNARYLALPTGEFQVTFSSEYASLVPGTLYWIVVTTSTSDNTNHPNLGGNSAGGYTNGSTKYNNTTDGWVTLASVDLYFKTLGGINSQVPIADTAGTIQATALKDLLAAVPLTAGTIVTNTSSETTSYTTNIDATYLMDPLQKLHIRMTGTFTAVSTTNPSGTFRIKLGGVTIASGIITATNATTPTGSIFIDVILYSVANGNMSSQYYSLQPTVSNITSNGVAFASTALASQPLLASSTAVDFTIQLGGSSNSSTANVLDVIIERF